MAPTARTGLAGGGHWVRRGVGTLALLAADAGSPCLQPENPVYDLSGVVETSLAHPGESGVSFAVTGVACAATHEGVPEAYVCTGNQQPYRLHGCVPRQRRGWATCHELRCPEDSSGNSLVDTSGNSCAGTDYCAERTEPHAVACCSDALISGWMACSGGAVWAERDALNGNDRPGCTGSCPLDPNGPGAASCQLLDFGGAMDYCHSLGARLCSAAELQAGCAHGTGCNPADYGGAVAFDSLLHWTSTAGVQEESDGTLVPTCSLPRNGLPRGMSLPDPPGAELPALGAPPVGLPPLGVSRAVGVDDAFCSRGFGGSVGPSQPTCDEATVMQAMTAETRPLEAGYAGGVLATDGKIYLVPFTATSVRVVDPKEGADTTIALDGLTDPVPSPINHWGGGVLAPDGRVYGIPYDHNYVLTIDTASATGSSVSSSNCSMSPIVVPK